MEFCTAIIGLGLMGASLAKGLKGFKDGRIVGSDNNPAARGYMESLGIECFETAGDAVREADLVVLCVYPRLAAAMLKKLDFPEKAVITDVCGVKLMLHRAAKERDLRYVGGHPMAGREKWGHKSSTARIFKDANFIITPESASREDTALVVEMARYLGCNPVFTTASRHDSMIAYTSQLAHVLASAIVRQPDFLETVGFEGGSFRDLMRVATLNDAMWPELFIENSSNLLRRLDSLIDDLSAFRTMLERGDAKNLSRVMRESTELKKQYLDRGGRGK